MSNTHLINIKQFFQTARRVRRAVFVVFLLIGAAYIAYIHLRPDYRYLYIAPGADVPKLSLNRVINLVALPPEPLCSNLIKFSPDGRLLAILSTECRGGWGRMHILIWDLKENRLQTNIPLTADQKMSIGLQGRFFWSPDSRVISFGVKEQWDALTGAALPELPLQQGSDLRLNKDGTKMLVLEAIKVKPYFRIYNLKDQTVEKIPVDGMWVQSAAWTSDDKILIGVAGVDWNLIGTSIDGHVITNRYDVGLRLIDPAGKEPIKGVWFPAIPETRKGYQPWKESRPIFLNKTDFPKNIIDMYDEFIDPHTLKITPYDLGSYSGGRDVLIGLDVLTPDGKRKFVKSEGWFDDREPITNAIVDMDSGKLLATFGGFYNGTNNSGIDISPDNQLLALGNKQTVEILNMQ